MASQASRADKTAIAAIRASICASYNDIDQSVGARKKPQKIPPPSLFQAPVETMLPFSDVRASSSRCFLAAALATANCVRAACAHLYLRGHFILDQQAFVHVPPVVRWRSDRFRQTRPGVLAICGHHRGTIRGQRLDRVVRSAAVGDFRSDWTSSNILRTALLNGQRLRRLRRAPATVWWSLRRSALAFASRSSASSATVMNMRQSRFMKRSCLQCPPSDQGQVALGGLSESMKKAHASRHIVR